MYSFRGRGQCLQGCGGSTTVISSSLTCPFFILPCTGPLSPICFRVKGPSATASSISLVRPGKAVLHCSVSRLRLASSSGVSFCLVATGVRDMKRKQYTVRQKPRRSVACLRRLVRLGGFILSPMACIDRVAGGKPAPASTAVGRERMVIIREAARGSMIDYQRRRTSRQHSSIQIHVDHLPLLCKEPTPHQPSLTDTSSPPGIATKSHCQTPYRTVVMEGGRAGVRPTRTCRIRTPAEDAPDTPRSLQAPHVVTLTLLHGVSLAPLPGLLCPAKSVIAHRHRAL